MDIRKKTASTDSSATVLHDLGFLRFVGFTKRIAANDNFDDDPPPSAAAPILRFPKPAVSECDDSFAARPIQKPRSDLCVGARPSLAACPLLR
jgi:hypothetical protein